MQNEVKIDTLRWVIVSQESVALTNNFLIGRTIFLLYRNSRGFRFRSECQVLSMNEATTRSLAGEIQHIVELQREDLSKCAIGLTMDKYWNAEKHTSELFDFLWGVIEEFAL